MLLVATMGALCLVHGFLYTLIAKLTIYTWGKGDAYSHREAVPS